MKIVYDKTHSQHAPDSEFSGGQLAPYPECPQRIESIRSALLSAGIDDFTSATAFDDGDLECIHDAQYLHFLTRAYDSWLQSGRQGDIAASAFARPRRAHRPNPLHAQAGYYGFDTTPIAAGTWPAARAAAGCARSAADLLLAGERVVYALCRPPGHHCGPDYFGGYCYLNNAALAAARLRARGKVAVLDIDYHHGNGTQDIFYDSADVLFVSLHADPAYQYPLYWGYAEERGSGEGEGFTHNFPLPAGTDDQRYLTTLEQSLRRIGDFAPDYLIISAGLDIYEGDPLGDFSISLRGLTEIGRRIGQCQWPILVVQEGGYNIDDLGEAAVRLLHPLAQ